MVGVAITTDENGVALQGRVRLETLGISIAAYSMSNLANHSSALIDTYYPNTDGYAEFIDQLQSRGWKVLPEDNSHIKFLKIKMKKKPYSWSGDFYGLTYGKEYYALESKPGGFYYVFIDSNEWKLINTEFFPKGNN